MSHKMSEQEKQAFLTALRLLAATPKSRKGLRDKLRQKGYAREVLNTTLDRLEQRGLLNDRSLAQSLCQSFILYKPSGRKRIAFELEKRGIRESLIQEVLAGYSPEEERRRAVELARSRWERSARLETSKRWKKVYGFLLRRGFDFSLARAVVEELKRGEPL